MKRALIVLFAGLVVLSWSVGCQTTEGFGRDLQDAGEAIEEEAD
jgi:predicted small secreted protein